MEAGNAPTQAKLSLLYQQWTNAHPGRMAYQWACKDVAYMVKYMHAKLTMALLASIDSRTTGNHVVLCGSIVPFIH
jgi:hypothetical protein